MFGLSAVFSIKREPTLKEKIIDKIVQGFWLLFLGIFFFGLYHVGKLIYSLF